MGDRLVLIGEDHGDEIRRRNIFEFRPIASSEIFLNVLANEMNNNTGVQCRDLQPPMPTPLFSRVLNVTVIGKRFILEALWDMAHMQ